MSLLSCGRIFHAWRKKSRANYFFIESLIRLPPLRGRETNQIIRAIAPITMPVTRAKRPLLPAGFSATPIALVTATPFVTAGAVRGGAVSTFGRAGAEFVRGGVT